MVHLSRLQVRNFKSLRNVDLELGKLNILIGRNGSGKSNLISFLKLLREAANERLAVTISRMGGVDEVFSYQAGKDELLEWIVTLDGLKNPDSQNASMLLSFAA